MVLLLVSLQSNLREAPQKNAHPYYVYIYQESNILWSQNVTNTGHHILSILLAPEEPGEQDCRGPCVAKLHDVTFRAELECAK